MDESQLVLRTGACSLSPALSWGARNRVVGAKQDQTKLHQN
jgi:hypothetical protein